ncbi:flagella synthesis protein FlgN [Endozoicomonas arenosclerae]|uniref:flagella synthesis protein FlgN n=1 Tax=Endozoicomonas arenosclerae TaxID=1633495 RepID=UPI00078673ED|nr:flagellar protein FlgN [Endozoicomonas arenosclerae]
MSAALVLNTISEACHFFIELENLLNQIHYQLLSRDISRLELSIKEQSRLLNKIRQNTELRIKLVEELGFSNDTSGMKQLLSTLPEEEIETAMASWSRLESGIRHCQELNKLNGRVQARLGTVTQRLIGMIDDHYYRLSTYSSKGVPVAVKTAQMGLNA